LLEEFSYFGSLDANDNVAEKDVKTRVGKARGAFARLQPVWKLKQYSLRKKLRLCNIMAKPVLLHGSDYSQVIKGDMNRTSAFHGGFLRGTCPIFWLNNNYLLPLR